MFNVPDQSKNIQHPDPVTCYLPAVGSWPKSWYWLDGKTQDAITLAIASGRPLLVRGLPGTGKSDLARAAATHLKRAFVYEVINASTESQDVLWRYDALSRLADAQINRNGKLLKKTADPHQPKHYITPGAFWWALNWQAAQEFSDKHCKVSKCPPDDVLQHEDATQIMQSELATTNGTVLLLDEIDKAESELPNSLLEVLANNCFRIPWSHQFVNAKPNKPLVIITTNEDRELPPAFVRRCLVLPLNPEHDFKAWIIDRAHVHFQTTKQQANDNRPYLSQDVIYAAADQLMEERKHLIHGHPQPGLAEFLDLLYGLQRIAPGDETQQLKWLKRVYSFAYQKQS